MTAVPRSTLIAGSKMFENVCYFILFIFLLRSSTCQASQDDDKGIPGASAHIHRESSFRSDHMSIANMTCKVFEQPLNHFVPRGRSPMYEERYCTYDGFATSSGVDKSPIFFYTGNESPLEQYINQVGLLGCCIGKSPKILWLVLRRSTMFGFPFLSFVACAILWLFFLSNHFPAMPPLT